MTRHASSTDALLDLLTQLGSQAALGPAAQAAQREVAYALGATSVEQMRQGEFPVLGYWLTLTPEHFVCYLVTPGRFLRAETLNGTALSISVPLTRVSRVVETRTDESLTLEVELDADAVTTALDGQRGPAAADGAAAFGGVARSTRTSYSMSLQHDPGNVDQSRAQMARLWEFARVLRSSMGV